MRSLLSLLVLFLAPAYLHAEEPPPAISVEVGQAHVKKTLVAFPPIQATNDSDSRLKALRETAMVDLDFSGLVDLLNGAAYLENTETAGISPGTFKMSDWTSIGAELVIKSKGSVENGKISLEVRIYSAQSGKQLLAKTYKADFPSARHLAHTVSNDVLLAITGKKGPFTSKLAAVCDKRGKKEIYVMDYDGFNPVRVTSKYEHTMSPAWSPDGKELLFSALTANAKKVRNHNLFSYNFKTQRFDIVSNRTGLNSGAVYSPDGKQIALTMSFPGNAEIFLLDTATKTPKRLTNNYALDVDPSWSPDGKRIAFISDRAGKSAVYVMNADGTDVERLTFAGDYNATPTWSPNGAKLAFAGWNGGKFDIFLINPDGTNLEAITSNMGNNEDPSFAPDSYFLAYSSNRSGKKTLYITNIDNTIHRQLNTGLGNCESPRWSPAE